MIRLPEVLASLFAHPESAVRSIGVAVSLFGWTHKDV